MPCFWFEIGRGIVNDAKENSTQLMQIGCQRLVCIWHDDVIKWQHFRVYWPFVRGNHRSWIGNESRLFDNRWCCLVVGQGIFTCLISSSRRRYASVNYSIIWTSAEKNNSKFESNTTLFLQESELENTVIKVWPFCLGYSVLNVYNYNLDMCLK